ncbi:ALR-like protein [Mya arenaria]|uniref:ALR-like protein n=1 Tax=Mya arenaria TaxID=6604 RepID=A0ABY7DHT9_MYAAR|nr:alanine racemase-like [Mya arenaria]XP_052788610.1 alanine racemase-like [Mya arenaria]XP_052788617.1 alanine racemase-like [Mya arenaria]XP_052788624.1 alanine racemase-like [Mya arenaria]XP_052788631.1 alanine racemase-like [Mya arenaria]WAQ96879.1 ALR-like protein [Mya arenaria]
MAEGVKDGWYQREFAFARRPTFLRVDLDVLLNNLKILKGQLSAHTEIIAVVKANAYGHGGPRVARFLERHGVSHFAVATALEGEELRTAGVHGNIQVFGNASVEEIGTMYENRLIPTIADVDFLSAWLAHWRKRERNTLGVENGPDMVGCVVIKVDSGMSRNGCQPEKLPEIVDFCDNYRVPVHSIMTHFAQSWDDPVFTQQQMDTFMAAVKPYRTRGVKLHVANSGAIVNKVGTDLDFVRPGISMYGQAPDTSEFGVNTSQKLGLRPVISWYAKASMVNRLQPERVVGYDKTYKCNTTETIAVIPVGYADGFLRSYDKLSVQTLDGTQCPLVGRVSMDAITVRLPEEASNARVFQLMTPDYTNVNSAVAMARHERTIPYEVCTNLDKRVPRLYFLDGAVRNDV